MNMQFETGKFITLMATENYATHVVVNKNKLFKTHVYLEHYSHLQEEEFNRRIEEFTIKYDYVFDSINSTEKAVVLVNSKNRDYIKIFCDRDEDGNKFYEVYLIEPDFLSAV